MLECGDKIGDYTLARFLGRGQFGEVWLAEKEVQFSTRKFQHALKFLFKREEEINLKAVEAEIDTWIEASGHPNVMSVLDMIVHKEYIIIASEYAEGGSLKRWLNRYSGKAPSHEKALEMMTGILSGIEHLHSRNVVHRDLKPDNILLQGNFPRITDFGISRIVSAGSLSTVAMGSPFYMSPESFDGSKSTQTDIWSAGVLLYEMLTGTHPYHSDTIYGLVDSIRHDDPKPLPNHIPHSMKEIVQTALQKDLSKRYPTARAMRVAIEQEVHNLKVRLSHQTDLLKADNDDFPLVTFKEVDFNRQDVIKLRKKAKETNKTNIKDTLERQPGEVMPGDLVSDAGNAPDPLQPLGWSQKTVTANAKKLQEPLDADSVANTEIGETEASPVSFADSGFGNSQHTPSKRPWLLAAAIGCTIVVGLGLGRSVMINMTGSFLNSSAADANTATTAIFGNPASKDNKPTPPPEMVYIPGGTFKMGRDNGEPEEKPEHPATVQPFFMDFYEVTNRKYADFLLASGKKLPARLKRSLEKEGNFPIVNIDWKHSNAYAVWAGKRLPTEEEWEFAARGTDDRLYPWGADWNTENANVDGGALKKVGSFPCNSPFKICDLVGNAWEWTASDFKYYDGSVPKTNTKGKEKTRRGHSYEGDKGFATATYRLGLASAGMTTGFRCVKNIE